MPAPKPITVYGVRYPSLTTACAAYGHSEPKVRQRMKTGLTLERALVAKDRRTGVKKHPSYGTWNSIRSRCFSKGNAGYPRYGAAGITMCDRWKNDFYAFVEDMGKRPSKAHSIDRFPNKAGNYEPGNCRWATRAEQMRNTRYTRLITHDGVTLCLLDWATRLGFHPSSIANRLDRGLSIKQALSKQRYNGRFKHNRIARENGGKVGVGERQVRA